MDTITVSPLVWIAVALVGAAIVVFAWRKERSKVEEVTIDALAATATGTITAMDKLLAIEQADVAQRQAELQANMARVAAAKQSLVALATPPAPGT